MKVRKRWIGIAIILLLLLITVTVIGAIYVKIRIKIKNEITIGNVQVKLHELDQSGEEVPDQKITVSGGEYIDRIVFVENTGDQTAFVRVSVTTTFTDDASGTELVTDQITLFFQNEERWIYKDGWYYYTEALETGEGTVPLLSGVHFSEMINESGKNGVFNLDIMVQGLQAKNNAEDVLEAVGWPEE